MDKSHTDNSFNKSTTLSPIALFVYNRLWHTQQTVEALKKNELAETSELFVFSDGPKSEADKEKVLAVRKYIKTILGFKSVNIVEREQNLGLANSIITGVTEIVNRYGKIIVMEDDLVTSPYFLTFMNNALTFYKDNPRIFTVTGYSFPVKIPKDYHHPVYLSYRHSSWGWGTWKENWVNVDWDVKNFYEFFKNRRAIKTFNRGGNDLADMLSDQFLGKIDSWSIRFDYHCFRYDGLCLLPVKSLVKNIGFDGSGIHCGMSDKYEIELPIEFGKNIEFTDNIHVDQRIIKEIKKKFNYYLLRRIRKIISKLNFVQK